MKTIVVSGARSKIGKTTLSRALCALLPGAVHVKLGHGKPKPGAGNVFYPAGTPVESVMADNAAAAFLVIESNRILESHRPDLAIYLPADAPKPSAAAARGKADLVRGLTPPQGAAELVARRLSVTRAQAEAIVRLVESGPAGPSRRGPTAPRAEGNADE